MGFLTLLPKNMRSDFFHLLQKELTPQTLGLIWFLNSALEERPTPFDELDYFLDGLLSQTLKSLPQAQPQHHFIKASQFSRPFYLIVLGPGLDKSEQSSLIEQDLKLMGEMANSKLLALNASSQLPEKKLEAKFDINIKHLDPS